MPKIIDAFLFNNELDVLELRLNELHTIVDHFVIVEALEFHGSARKRKAVLAANWDVVKPFEKMIKYVVLDHLVPPYTDSGSGWARENFHRLSLTAPVMQLSTSADDLVILSDCDEIPSARCVRDDAWMTSRGLCVFELDFFYYNVNSYVSPWTRSTIGTVRQYQLEGGFQKVRDNTNGAKQYIKVPNAGWHLSYFGDVERIRSKVENFAHSADKICTDVTKRSDAELVADIVAHRDLYRRPEMLQFTRRDSDDRRLPVHFLNNRAKYVKFTEEFWK
jgi:beta-1,4-mannosyl-glycoprotein beta-1,4-N-acetylglucosaminyltransferase